MDTMVSSFRRLLKDNDIENLIAACNAAGLSAFYFVERRMTRLSKELFGIVLPHDSSGTHFAENGKTIDNVKELENFKKMGELLSEIGSEMTIGSYQTSAKWVYPSDESNAY